MLDTLGYRPAISKALGAHTIAGLCAGIIAHFVYLLFSLL
jgi:biopolymer transport protein ExbB/TolQ